MKQLLLIFVSLLLMVSRVQAQPVDSSRIRQALMLKSQLQLMRRVDSLSGRLSQLSRTNDSLNKELYYFRAKDDFYAMAVDRQGSHFEWLLGIALALTGLISYGYFRDRIEKIRNEFVAGLSKYEIEVKKTTYRLHRQSAFSLSGTAQLFEMVGTLGKDEMMFKETNIQLNILQAEHEVRAYLLVDRKDSQEVSQALTDVSYCLRSLKHEIEVVYERLELKASRSKAKILFNYPINQALNTLNEAISQIDEEPLRFLLMELLVKVNKLREIHPT